MGSASIKVNHETTCSTRRPQRYVTETVFHRLEFPAYHTCLTCRECKARLNVVRRFERKMFGLSASNVPWQPFSDMRNSGPGRRSHVCYKSLQSTYRHYQGTISPGVTRTSGNRNCRTGWCSVLLEMLEVLFNRDCSNVFVW